MPWDLNNLNPSQVFIWDESVKDELKQEWIELRLDNEEITQSIFKEIGISEKVEWKKDPKTRAMQRVTYFAPSDEQMKEFNERLWDYTIVDWKMLLKNGSEIPCNREMKAKFMRTSPVFRKFYEDKMDAMREEYGFYKEEIEKN